MTFIRCGDAPTPVGHFDAPSKEMMFYLYLPVSIPGRWGAVPERLKPFVPMLDAACKDFGNPHSCYCYLTVKTMFVTPECPGNRPGWHIDGFGSGGDVNYIWASINPTEFAVQEFRNVSDNDRQSMLDIRAQIDFSKIRTWPNGTLLRLDETVVHRVSPTPIGGMRSFVKITFSRHQFRNEGNSHNYLLEYDWREIPRSMERNIDHG